MDRKRHMLWRTDAKVRYSAAYPTGAERSAKSFTMGAAPIVLQSRLLYQWLLYQ